MKLSGRACKCAVCGAYFGSDSAFLRHRTGPADNRTCLNPEAVGMEQNSRGMWITEKMPVKAEPKWRVA